MMTNNYKPFIGGVPVSIERLSKSLRSLGHKVVIFAPSHEQQEEEADVVRYRSLFTGFGGSAPVPNSLDPLIERRFRDEGFDIIHVHHPMLIGKTALYLSRKYKLPLVFSSHTRYEHYLHYLGLSCLKSAVPLYIREYAKHCDMVFAPAQTMKEYLEQIGSGFPVSVLPTGLPSACFNPCVDDTVRIREQLLAGHPSGTRLFCTVSRLAKEKNISFLLRSMQELKKWFTIPFVLAVVGDGPERENLAGLALELGLDRNIVFTGNVPNETVSNYCAASDLFLFASASETQGIVLLEAMAAGTPVIALKAPGTDDIVESGKNGYLSDSSEQMFARLLVKALSEENRYLFSRGAVETAGCFRDSEVAKRAIAGYHAAILRKQEKLLYRKQYGIFNSLQSLDI